VEPLRALTWRGRVQLNRSLVVTPQIEIEVTGTVLYDSGIYLSEAQLGLPSPAVDIDSGSQAHRLQASVNCLFGGVWGHHTWLLTMCRSPRWRADDIFDLLRPAASLSLGQQLHLAEGTSQSLEQQFGTIFRPICDSTRSHCCHLDKN